MLVDAAVARNAKGVIGSEVSQEQSNPANTAYYTLARVSGDSNVNDYVLSATPVGPQTADTACGTLTINQAGAKTKTGSRDLLSCW